MPQLTADSPRVFKSGDTNVFGTLPVAASTTIFEGSAVGSNSGNMRQLVAADPFYGFCEKRVGPTTAADVVEVRKAGTVIANVVGATAVSDVGATVAMSDGDVFTLTTASNSTIGKVSRWLGGTLCEVYFESVDLRSL